MSLVLYNTLTRQKETFVPLHKNDVGLYTCGPTVYDFVHIGNLRAFVFDDLLRRYLAYRGYHVTHVMNITDVGHLVSEADTGEDKMEKGARREGKSAWEIAESYTNAFLEDSKALNLLAPDIMPRATAHIPDQIALIQRLEEKGYTYRTSDGVYFDTSRFPHYGRLGHLNIEGQSSDVRKRMGGEKRQPADFALWKFSPTGATRQMEWGSPWGKGFPGWHIECSAMSMRYLGETFDIHCGGVDHIPVHHTNEIAQSEAATGKPFVRTWCHNEFLLVDGGKMAKSLGNTYTLRDIIARGFSPMALRYLFLGAHYRSKLNFTWQALGDAGRALDSIVDLLRLLLDRSGESSESVGISRSLTERFTEALDDDLNTPEVLAAIHTAIAEIYRLEERHQPIDGRLLSAAFFDLDKVLGLNLAATTSTSPVLLPEAIRALVEARERARTAQDFATADQLRRELLRHGFTVDDTAEGPKVKRSSHQSD
ncbi:MAG: cysteine--tRNA ligase [Parcubacteria group bacterium]|nr:cysteine--tRNA ligase [Parcubacteria group bacterium]